MPKKEEKRKEEKTRGEKGSRRKCADLNIRSFNISKAKRDLGYKPLVPLSEGLDLTIKYFQDQEALQKRAKKMN